MGAGLALLGPPIMTALFIGWILYHLIIKKDAKKYRNDILGGLMFISVWAVIYFVFIK
ncbi:hypothetical protein [Mucilaginibacter jinjuensis]|uniref:Uncharacterized protein n=1 Tax=Mucilaginibacter jinjuensis TaxID=1176721 RepID=A0ABY7T4Q6_9SPHI|nr:hypothetical protein [Mucilaginibacter jinjuensis]WCT11444.1 hypothetical protein PQO05_22145 [Mucilaginibacter jinjuensis]